MKTAYLEGSDGSALESEIGFEVLSNLPDETLEGQFADQQLSRLLVTPDLTERHGTGPVPVGLLHSTSRGSRFPGSLLNKKITKNEVIIQL